MKKRNKVVGTAEVIARDNVAKQIRELKAEKGLTITDLAIDADISDTYLCAVYREDGMTFPSFETMIRIFNALGQKEITIKWE